MKKNIGIILVLAAFLGSAVLGFAQDTPKPNTNSGKLKMEIFRGKIIGLNQTKNKIIMKDDKTQTVKVFFVDPKKISSLKIGDEVRVKALPGSVKAVKIWVLKTNQERRK